MIFISERDRLHTFRNWPHSKPYPLDLVQAGFHYTKRDDTVACSFCNKEMRDWKQRQDPMSEHRRLSPNCLYIREYSRKESSLLKFTKDGGSKSSSSHSKTDAVNESILVNPSQIHLAGTVQKETASRSLDYTKEKNRLTSFVGWTGRVDPRQLAHAGLFYLGTSDRVQCFSCQTIFRDWEAGDDPWIEHSKWYPDCPYIQLCLGKDVVREIRRNVLKCSSRDVVDCVH